MEKLRKVLYSYRRSLLSKENVVGVGVGQKMIRGEKTDETTIVVFVTRKVDKKEISSQSLVPQKIKGVKTDVVEIGEVKALPLTERVRPAYPGVSIGHYSVTAGTFGAVVRSRKTDELLILSNNHVLANVSNGKDGRAKKGDPILQPGPADGGTLEKDIIGNLDSFVPIVTETEDPECNIAAAASMMANSVVKRIRPNYRVKFEKVNNTGNLVDAALAKPVATKVITNDIPEIGRIKGTAKVEIGDRLKKVGRTSGLTKGTVDALDATLMVSMGEGIKALFEGQIVSDIKSLPGDSGSIVVNNENKAIGLLFAGSDIKTVINPIDVVMDKLEIELV